MGYIPPVVDFQKVRKSVTIPDQSLSIQEIVKRYVRGIPVDVVQRPAIYIDQNEDDLEKLSRLDFGDKAEYAEMLAQRSQRLAAELGEAQASANEAKAKQARLKAKKAAKAGSIVVP